VRKVTLNDRGRRRFLLAAGGTAASAMLSIPKGMAAQATASAIDPMGAIVAYIANGATADLPTDVVETMKRHILDTLAAIVSGSKLIPGRTALKYIRGEGGDRQAQVIATGMVTSAVNAAFVNGMMAHSDETDDSHRATLVHPGAAIIPAALAMAERENAGGDAFLKSVVVGYDLGCRMVLALDPDHALQGSAATPGIGGCFGAACASAAVARLPADRIPYVLSYAAQQASGVNSWMRDQEHVEKAFVFAGMPARNGVTATELVRSGFTGESDPLRGSDNFLDAFSSQANLTRLTDGMGRRYEVMFTDMKRFPVGFPIQAATDAMLKLIARGLTPADVRSMVLRLPAPGVRTVNDRAMPDVNVQYVVAATLIDRTLTFDAAHSLERMKDPAVLALKQRITLVEDVDLTAQKRTREANIEVTKVDGTLLQEHGISRGAIENPMSREEVEDKARELMAPILGRDRTQRLIRNIWNLEQVRAMRELRSLLSA
jgi:2-methylcitrate dehydratase PrpD